MPQVYLAICAIFRDESRYLREWIEFHKLVGVDHFFLYDNGSIDDPERVLQPYLAEGSVTLRPWPIPFHQYAQRDAYADCIERARGVVRWLAMIDIDEFLFSPGSDRLTPVLRQYETYPAVVAHWQIYGSSHNAQASDAPVIERFTHRGRTDWVRNRKVKSIVDPARTLRPIGMGCHHFEYAGNASAVNERGEPVYRGRRNRYKKALRPFYRQLAPLWDALNLDPYNGTDITNRSLSIEHLRINHYAVKSREEFLQKVALQEGKAALRGHRLLCLS
jgi:hypothetical protein